MKKQLTLLLLFLLSNNISFSIQENSEPIYPKTLGFTSVLHPIVTFNKNGSSFNFKDSYTVGFPVGINILKSDKIGFSFEITPFIKTEKGKDRVSNFLFHPGIMFLFKHGFTFITRMAFETNGRYGLTPVFNKILTKTKNINYLTAVSIPIRFGNDAQPSVGLGLQCGISF